MNPIAAAVAGPEPDMEAKNMQPSTVEHVHFGRRLGVRRELEDDLHAGDPPRLGGTGDHVGGGDQREGAARDGLAEPGVDLAARAAGQKRAELKLGAPGHRQPGEHVLGSDGRHEAGRRQDRHPARAHVFGGDHALDAAEVVGVAVGVGLNPRIGRDWMLPGTQKEVPTPGQNQKHYLAGALHTRTGQVLWVGNGRKTSYLFLLLLRRLREAFPRARTLHVGLDNYGIHSSQAVQRALTEEFSGRIVLHFLPPYSPKHNRIERLWREPHANVTRNHRCRTLPELLHNVEVFLRRASPYPGTKTSLIRIPKRRAA